MKNPTPKQVVSEFLGFLKYKVDSDTLTIDDVKAMADMIMHGLPVIGTVADIAGFYGRSEDAVRHVISRSVFEKPRRRVHYTFRNICKVVPDSWRKIK